MGFGAAVASAFGKYATFRGRATRSEFWWFYLFYAVVLIVLQIVDNLLGFHIGGSTTDITVNGTVVPIVSQGFGVLSTIASLAMLLPFLAVGARRLHDAGHSGLWLLWGWLLSFACCVGIIILIVFWCQRSEPGETKYGPQPVQ